MIELKNIVYNYSSVNIFNNFSIELADNQLVAIIGASGTGKSTFLDLLLGFVYPQKGSIFYDKIKLDKNSVQKIRNFTAWMPQNFNVPFDTVEEMFFAPFNLKINKNQKPDKNKISEIFEILNIDIDLLTKNIDQISGGQKQRVMLASIFLLEKKYFFIDEPTSALDENSANKLIDFLQQKKQNATIIVSTHDNKLINSADLIVKIGQF
jgi:ABC-type lipoprotein export system ATPase subunit